MAAHSAQSGPMSSRYRRNRTGVIVTPIASARSSDRRGLRPFHLRVLYQERLSRRFAAQGLAVIIRAKIDSGTLSD